MKSTVSAITLGVRSMQDARRFYVDGLGWRLIGEQEGEIVFLQLGPGQILALWNAGSMTGEYGDVGHGPQAPPMSLGQNVDSPQEVDAVLAQAVQAGATLVSPGRRQAWGGYSGCFADPDGFRWDIVHNPGFTVEPDGTVRMG